MNENEIIKKIEERYKKGEISRDTYESIVNEYKKDYEKEEEGKEGGNTGGVSIAGSGTVERVKGEYLRISGSGRVEGDVDVREMKVAGSAKIEGNIKAEKVRCAGSCRVEGDLKANEIKISGSIQTEGSIISDIIEIAGSCRVEGDLKARIIHSEGGTRCEGTISAEKKIGMGGMMSALAIESPEFTGKGAINVENTVKSRIFRLEMDGSSSVKDIYAERIEIISGSSGGIISRILGKKGSMKARNIRGKTVNIENTVADLVEGENVNIGPGCRIKVLKAPKAKVHESSKVIKRA